jgi:hypothetical protein
VWVCLLCCERVANLTIWVFSLCAGRNLSCVVLLRQQLRSLFASTVCAYDSNMLLHTFVAAAFSMTLWHTVLILCYMMLAHHISHRTAQYVLYSCIYPVAYSSVAYSSRMLSFECTTTSWDHDGVTFLTWFRVVRQCSTVHVFSKHAYKLFVQLHMSIGPSGPMCNCCNRYRNLDIHLRTDIVKQQFAYQCCNTADRLCLVLLRSRQLRSSTA